MTVLLALIAVAWGVVYIIDFTEALQTRWLTPHTKVGLVDTEDLPPVSIVVPARNESAVVERALLSLLNLDYPDFEVILVNDQSTDGTEKIARKIAESDGRFAMINGADLPEGWLGKSWALHQGVQRAKGKWLLFTDADCLHHPVSLRVGIENALVNEREFVSLLPSIKLTNLWERVLMLPFFVVFGTFFPLHKINKHSSKALAAGGFMLVKRDAYDVAGGHTAIRSAIVDDIHLAQSIKRTGGKVWATMTRKLVVTEQYGSFAEVWEGLRKHAFRLMGKSAVGRPIFVFRAAVFVLAMFLMVAVPLVGLGIGVASQNGWVTGLAGASVLIVVLLGLGGTWMLGSGLGWALFLPFGLLIYLLIVIHSVVQVRRGKLVWSGRQYGR